MKINFDELYEGEIELQRERYENLKKGFKDFFSYESEFELFSAPGRTEVGGNHTDHQRGKVLAASVNMDIAAVVVKKDDGIITVKSEEYAKHDVIDTSDLEIKEEEKEHSAAVIRGLCARFKQLGFEVGGFDCYTKSNVLKGSGLSSSAAFEVLIGTIINHLYNEDKATPVQIAQMSQYAENVYFGKPSGLLDQSASSVGGFTAIDFKDKENPIFEKVDFNLDEFGYKLCVVDTGGNHADITYEYAAIPIEMKKVAEYFGKEVLCEVDESKFYENIAVLRKEIGDRAVLRAMHFYDDDRFASLEKKALKAKDFNAFLELVKKSGKSSALKLQNVSTPVMLPEQGVLLALAISEKALDGKGACRVHGGGFAGTIQAYVPNELLDDYICDIEKVFGKGSCHVLKVRPVGGVKIEG